MFTNLFSNKYSIEKGFLFLISDVSVILGGEADGLFEQSVTTVETYSTKCGLFDANLPPLPKARKLLGAAYLDGR